MAEHEQILFGDPPSSKIASPVELHRDAVADPKAFAGAAWAALDEQEVAQMATSLLQTGLRKGAQIEHVC